MDKSKLITGDDLAALRKTYGVLLDRIAAILFETDPLGINFRTNTDEYEPEAATILPRLGEAGSAQDVEKIVHEELCRWFDAEDVGPQENYRVVAATIWQAWCASARPLA